jgi:hypothetical protein
MFGSDAIGQELGPLALGICCAVQMDLEVSEVPVLIASNPVG